MNEIKNEDELIKKSIELLKNCKKFYEVMKKIIIEWPNSAQTNLTNISRNRQAWLGQASCCYNHGAPEYITKLAWHLLNEEEKNNANKTADKIINAFDKNFFCINENIIQSFLTDYA